MSAPSTPGRRILRSRLLLAAAVAVGLIGMAAPSPSARSMSPRKKDGKPPVVLVHGAFASPAGWERVAAALHKDGYETAAPALGLDSLGGDVSIVQATLDSIAGDKILVGHSYGGFVISNAATGRTDVRGLVYTAAYVPDTGETSQSLNAGYAPAAFLAPGHLELAPSFPYVIIDPQY